MLYEKLFPSGMEKYGEKELWEVYDKLGTEIHNRGLERRINERMVKVLKESGDYNDFMKLTNQDNILRELSIHDLTESWNEYWEGLKDDQVENEIDDFRTKEDDFVK